MKEYCYIYMRTDQIQNVLSLDGDAGRGCVRIFLASATTLSLSCSDDFLEDALDWEGSSSSHGNVITVSSLDMAHFIGKSLAKISSKLGLFFGLLVQHSCMSDLISSGTAEGIFGL
mmetsp:Transcript_6213/g.12212  ORF Transcript_6213/g.12212 Transcript_6213/m.12212 type:complete len:116 (-) Transcript_6213:240-587(-)